MKLMIQNDEEKHLNIAKPKSSFMVKLHWVTVVEEKHSDLSQSGALIDRKPHKKVSDAEVRSELVINVHSRSQS